MTALDTTSTLPSAHLLGTFPADSDEWHAARRGGIGGSDIVAVLGMSRWDGSTPYGVWEDKTGRGRPLPLTWPLFRGHADEAKLRAWFTLQTGVDVAETGTWVHREHDWMRVNPDGLASDGGGFEAKSHSFRMAEEWTDEQVSDAAELQAQWGMAVTGLGHWWVCAQIGQDEPLIRRVERDEVLIATLVDAASRFWHEHVLTDVPPPVTGLDLEGLKDRYRDAVDDVVTADRTEVERLIAEVEAAKAAIKAAEAARADAEAKLRAIAGEHQGITTDGGFARVSLVPNGTFAARRFEEAHPDLAAAYQTTTSVLDVTRLRAEHPKEYAQYRARVLRIHTPKEK